MLKKGIFIMLAKALPFGRAVILFSFLVFNNVYAATPSLTDVLAQLSTNVPSLMRLVTALAYVMGMWFVIIGVNKLKQFGESRTMMSSEHSLKGPLIFLVVGAMLLYLPSTVQSGLQTLWEHPNVLSYKRDIEDPWQVLMLNSLMILQLIGTIAFIRGLVLLTSLGHQGGQHGTFARAMAHIIGGILLINMFDTVNMMLTSFGLSSIFNS